MEGQRGKWGAHQEENMVHGHILTLQVHWLVLIDKHTMKLAKGERTVNKTNSKTSLQTWLVQLT